MLHVIIVPFGRRSGCTWAMWGIRSSATSSTGSAANGSPARSPLSPMPPLWLPAGPKRNADGSQRTWHAMLSICDGKSFDKAARGGTSYTTRTAR